MFALRFIDHNHKRQVAEKYLPKGAVDEIKTIAKFSKSALQEEKTLKPVILFMIFDNYCKKLVTDGVY